MTEQEQMARALLQAYLGNESVKSALNEKGFLIISSSEVDALKAQVNCLREGLSLALVKIADDDDNDIQFMDVYAYMQKTPEHCLAEVKAKAIEGVREQIGLLQRYSFLALHQHPSVTKVPDQSGRWIDRDAVDDLIEKHINSLLEQAR